jgi:hypothetical protein
VKKQNTSHKAETVAKHLKPHGKRWATRGERRKVKEQIRMENDEPRNLESEEN